MVAPRVRKALFDNMAPHWDVQMESDEWKTGIYGMRKEFLKRYCKGKVLEVACGTGSNVVRRNGEILYDVGAIDELHQFEYSKEMLKQ